MQGGKMLVTIVAIMAVVVVDFVIAQPIQVNCDTGDSLAAAVVAAQPGATIQVSGTCNEDVTITVDRITLDGGGAAVIDGSGVVGQVGAVFAGLLTVDGAQGVTVTGLTVQNSSVDGILVQNGAAATVENITVQDSADDGIQVSNNATAQLVNCIVERSGEFGLVATFNASARVLEGLISRNNGSHGIVASNISHVLFSTGTIEASNNETFGIVVFGGSRASIGRTGPTVVANANGIDGILLAEKAHLQASGGMLTASQNGRDALFAAANSLFVASGATINLNGNTGNGITLTDGSQVTKLPPGELNIQNNPVSGITADFGSIVNLLGGATMTDNGPTDARSDLNLSFGTMANITGENTIGVTVCDATVLLRGDIGVTCPTP